VLGGESVNDLETVRLRKDGARVPVSGKYIVVWQRGEDGAWRLYRDIWNMNPAPAE